MKKTVTAHLMVLLLSCVSICQTASFAAEPTENTQSETGNLFAFCEDEIKEFADHFDETQIVSLVYRRNHEASQETIITDPASIRRVWEALGQISVIGITQEYASDWDDIFCFTLPDANAYRFAFNAKHLEVNGVCYELSGDEDLWLLADDLAQLQYNYMNQGGGSAAGVTIDGTVCTAADRTYSFVYEGTPYRANIITYTGIIQVSQTVGSLSCLWYIWSSPYTYVYWAPETQYEEEKAAFDLFAANTSVSDAFLVAVGNLSTELSAEISLGKSATTNDVISGLSSQMSSAEDTYREERFTDYILSQNSYTTSDGSVIKVPNSYDYVYEGDDGTIYVSNSADGPAGSTRLSGN